MTFEHHLVVDLGWVETAQQWVTISLPPIALALARWAHARNKRLDKQETIRGFTQSFLDGNLRDPATGYLSASDLARWPVFRPPAMSVGEVGHLWSHRIGVWTQKTASIGWWTERRDVTTRTKRKTYYVIAVFYHNGRVDHVAFVWIDDISLESATRRFAVGMHLPLRDAIATPLSASVDGPLAVNFANRCLIQAGRAGRWRNRRR